MTAVFRWTLGLLLVLASVTLAQAAERVIVILDASGSMWGQIDGKPKQEIARQSLRTALTSLPADEEIGFMAYGHRQKGSCDDIELIVPPAAGTASQIASAADKLKFLGKTPLTAAVREAAQALKYTEDKAKIVLITDGLETCQGDPCALGKELEAAGVDFTVDVVGFDLTADEGRQVACLAENTGGKYIQAADANALEEALAQTVAATTPIPAPQTASAPEPAKPEFNFMPSVVLAEGGEAIASGNAWEIYKARPDGTQGSTVTTEYGSYPGNLDPGDYIVVARLGEARVEQKLKVEEGQAYEPRFVLNAGTLIIHPRPSEGAEIADGAHVLFDYPGGSRSEYGDTKIVLPAGEQKVTVRIGNGSVSETIQLAPGQTVEKDIVVGIGHVVVNAYYAANGDKADVAGIGFRIVEATRKTDGSREDVEHSYGADSKFDLPPGAYVAIADLDATTAEQPFTVTAGETGNVEVVLDAGVLAVSAPGAYRVGIVAAHKDMQGKRRTLAGSYGESLQSTLPAGDYVVVKTLPDDSGTREIPISVKAGARAEITVQ